jgi:hypothetical protein
VVFKKRDAKIVSISKKGQGLFIFFRKTIQALKKQRVAL